MTLNERDGVCISSQLNRASHEDEKALAARRARNTVDGLMASFHCVHHLRLTYCAKESVVIAFPVQQHTNVMFYVMLHEFFELFKSITGPTFVDFRLLFRFGVIQRCGLLDAVE
jgi:hypothetical protein